ncbi:CHOLESTEROL TRANSPORTER-RELATED [Ceraceosorus bombacis]|uniref:CHOLESTEROL TRANSPORTER-RELATED n=1 Tax=Ceraceosorus bombacis TaxID=401625 RepID=A0A0P1BIS0_9BASI|nr:CHOLESTEROL TRANSPORTER-RELATED [Ceraceosorus bombacis]
MVDKGTSKAGVDAAAADNSSSHASWNKALESALNTLRILATPAQSDSKAWRAVQQPAAHAGGQQQHGHAHSASASAASAQQAQAQAGPGPETMALAQAKAKAKQEQQQQQSSNRSVDAGSGSGSGSPLNITLYWSWDLRGAWLGMPAGGLAAQLPSILHSFASFARDEAPRRVPTLSHYGSDVQLLQHSFQTDRDTLLDEYQVLPAAGAHEEAGSNTTTLTWLLPRSEIWDVRLSTRAFASAPDQWTVEARAHAHAHAHADGDAERIALLIHHAPLTDVQQSVRATFTAQRILTTSTGPTDGAKLRINGEPIEVHRDDATPPESRVDNAELVKSILPPSAAWLSSPLQAHIDDAASVSGLSISTQSSATDLPARSLTPAPRPPLDRLGAISSLVRRNYIYFTSLLQEPEAKWKHVSDTRGVTVTQLDSIDPTLVVYRAEATFVGVGVWDLFSTITTPGAHMFWDKGVEEAALVDDAGDATRLWWTKRKAAWPVAPRDSVTVETCYKGPSAHHVFSFSTDDRALFPKLPAPATPTTIRTQVDLRGWSIESLNPTTVHVSLIEQSDPGGWTSKSATPAAMSAAVSGVGDYAIKNGAPPTATRVLGAHVRTSRYEHDKSTYRLEYGLAEGQQQHVECELRCDADGWCCALDLVVDPPPISVSCLRRWRGTPSGASGLWLTIEHVAASLEDTVARITVRKLKQKETNKREVVVLVNGARMRVDVEEVAKGAGAGADTTHAKRSKPRRVPLDLPSQTLSPRKKESDATTSATPATEEPPPTADARYASRSPMGGALDVLYLLRRIAAERSLDPSAPSPGWSLVGAPRNGLFVRRKMMSTFSSTIAVQRGDKVVEGFTAEDICGTISRTRRKWDETIDARARVTKSFGSGAFLSTYTTKGVFPFKGRSFDVATLIASDECNESRAASPSATNRPSVLFCASASYDSRHDGLDPSKVNPLGLPTGRVLIDGWILETLDPYSATHNHPIPSTRCTHVVAVDYKGNVPIAVNTHWNANLPRAVLNIEDMLKRCGPAHVLRSPAPAVHVRGDEMDENRGLVWTLKNSSAPIATLLEYAFDADTRQADVLIHIPPREVRDPDSTPTGAKDPDDLPFPRVQPESSHGHAQLPSNPPSRAASRATSLISLRGSRPSTIRSQPRDTTLVDAVIELRHYASVKGYDVHVSSALSAGTAPLGLSALPPDVKTRDVPCTVQAFDLPPSAALAATLDPGSRPQQHLLRVSIPDSVFAHGSATDLPQWYTDLGQRGALVRLLIAPRTSDNAPADAAEDVEDEDASPVRPFYDQRRLDVTHVNATSAMLQRESSGTVDENLPTLERLPASAGATSHENDAPAPLRIPKAVRLDLLPDLGPAKVVLDNEPSTDSKVSKKSATSPPSTPRKDDVRAADASPIKEYEAGSTSAALMNVLNTYPLSRLGASTALSAATADGGIFTTKRATMTTRDDKDGKVVESSDAAQAAANSKAADNIVPGAMSAVSEPARQTAAAAVRALGGKHFSLATLILASLVAFLLGSLFRGLLEPSDFLLAPVSLPDAASGSTRDAATEVRRLLDGLPVSSTAPHADQVARRELRRLVELKGLVAGWNVVLAVVRR